MPILNNAVPMAVHNQIRWERDQAMQQLKDHGIPFGGVAPNVVEVVRCEKCGHCKTIFPEKRIDQEPTQVLFCEIYRCNRKPDEFCSDGERRKNNG